MVALDFRDKRKCSVRVIFLFEGPPFPLLSPNLKYLNVSPVLTAFWKERARVCQVRTIFQQHTDCGRS